jgi:tetratricopeptide (TPR) repeat protein
VALAADEQFEAAIVVLRRGNRASAATWLAARNDLALALIQLRRADEAINELRQALAITADDRPTLHNLGLALMQKADYTAAITTYRRLLELAPEDAEGFYNLGLALKYKDDFDSAGDGLSPGDRTSANPARGPLLAGVTLLQQSKIDEAAKAFRGAIGAKSDFAEARYMLRHNPPSSRAISQLQSLSCGRRLQSLRKARSTTMLWAALRQQGDARRRSNRAGGSGAAQSTQVRSPGGPLRAQRRKQNCCVRERSHSPSIDSPKRPGSIEPTPKPTSSSRSHFARPAALEEASASLRRGRRPGVPSEALTRTANPAFLTRSTIGRHPPARL